MALTQVKKMFIAEYQRNGQNATQAYLKLKPNIKLTCAHAGGSRLLRDIEVQAALDRKTDRVEVATLLSRASLTREAYDIAQEAREAGEYTGALKGIELTGKFQRMFEIDTPDLEGYKTLMQTLIVVQSPPPDAPSTSNVSDVIELESIKTSKLTE